MDDKIIMENLLNVTKGVCDLYMHGSIESSSPKVHRAFTDALNEALSMRSCIYREMSEKGWYQNQQAPQQQLDQVKQKFSAQA